MLPPCRRGRRARYPQSQWPRTSIGPPINYSSAKPENVGHPAAEAHRRRRREAPFTDEHGYLPAVLKELKVPVSSQMLVFSKTSLQRDRIAPRTPRALYFNDDVYVGFCRLGEVMEVSVADPELGTVFYTLDQEPAAKPRFRAADGQLPLVPPLAAPGHPGATWCGRSIRTARATRSSPAGRSAPTTPARSRNAGADGT